MAKFNFELEYTPREALGKGASRRLRRHENKVLGVIYGGEEKPQSICLETKLIGKALETDAAYSHILTLIHQGKKQKVVLKAVQRHPFKSRILHMDFMRVSENKAITMHVPLHFLGQESSPGVLAGGTVTHHMVELEVKCFPRNLPESIEVDLSQAQMDDVIHLSQISLPKGVELLTTVHSAEDDLPVVSIHLPKLIVEAEETPAAPESPAEDAQAAENKPE